MSWLLRCLFTGDSRYLGMIHGKHAYLTRHAITRIRERHISLKHIVSTLYHPWKKLCERVEAHRRGYTRYMYLSKKHNLIVVTGEDDEIIVVTAIYTSKKEGSGLKNKKWSWLGNEIRWGRTGRLAYIINIGDVEIWLDENGVPVEIAIRNPEKHIDKEILEKIAYKEKISKPIVET
jgi:hypothetical protein